MMYLAPRFGRMTAHSIVYRTCMKAYEEEAQMKDALMAEPEFTEAFTEDEIDYMLDPHNYLGLAVQFADLVLQKYYPMNTKGAVTKQPLKSKKLLVDYMKSTNNFFVFPSKKGPEGPFSLV